MSAILRIAHVWIVVWIRRPANRRTKVEIPEVRATRHAANRRDVAVAKLVAAHARLDILADVWRPRRVVRAERHAAMDVSGIPGCWERYRYASPSLRSHRVRPIAGCVFVGKEYPADIHLRITIHRCQGRPGCWTAYFAHRDHEPDVSLIIIRAGLKTAHGRDHVVRYGAVLVGHDRTRTAIRFHCDVVGRWTERPDHVPNLVWRDRT